MKTVQEVMGKRRLVNKVTDVMEVSIVTEIEEGDVDSRLRYYLEKIDDLVRADAIKNNKVTRASILRAQTTYLTNGGFLAAITTESAISDAKTIFQTDLNCLLQRRYNV